MKIIVFILILISGTAVAGHHREHAQLRIDNALAILSTLRALEDKIEEICYQGDFSEEEIGRWARLKAYNAGIVVNLNFIHWQLNKPEADLNDLRRRLDTPLTGKPFSIITGITNVTLESSELGRSRRAVGDPCTDRYQKLVLKHGRAWQQLDQAAWHIVDAILEEQFGQ